MRSKWVNVGRMHTKRTLIMGVNLQGWLDCSLSCLLILMQAAFYYKQALYEARAILQKINSTLASLSTPLLIHWCEGKTTKWCDLSNFRSHIYLQSVLCGKIWSWRFYFFINKMLTKMHLLFGSCRSLTHWHAHSNPLISMPTNERRRAERKATRMQQKRGKDGV